MRKLLLLLLLAGFIPSYGGGFGGAYSALFVYGPKHLRTAQEGQETNTYTLTVIKEGTGSGRVVFADQPEEYCIDTASNEESCSISGYSPGEEERLTAQAYPGSRFVGWGRDCAHCGANSTCRIIMNSNKTCTVIFEQTSSGGDTGGGTGGDSGSGGGSGGGTGGTGGGGTAGGTGGGGGGCSMGVGTSPINALAYLLLPMLVALRRFIRR